MEHFFDTVYDYISSYLFCDEYNQDDVFYINPFDIDEIIEVHTLEEAGYDLNDDGSVYRDSNGRPVNTDNDDYYHLVDDIITFDETGKRVPNVEYIDKLVLRYFGVK
jgi:hypothetical protein